MRQVNFLKKTERVTKTIFTVGVSYHLFISLLSYINGYPLFAFLLSIWGIGILIVSFLYKYHLVIS